MLPPSNWPKNVALSAIRRCLRSLGSGETTGHLNLRSTAEIAEEFLALTAKGRAEKTVKDLQRLCQFARAFPCPLNNVSTAEVDAYLSGLRVPSTGELVAGKTFNNHRSVIGSLFRYAKSRRYIAPSHPGISEVDRVNVIDGEVGIFSPEHLDKVLRAARREMVPLVTIGAFAGLRTAEICCLDWSEVDLDGGWIEVLASNAKRRVRRLVPIKKNLRK